MTSPNHKPLIIAHRGASGHEPENTLRAFASAKKMGADGLELDIFLTSDHHIVVTHNINTEALTGQKMSVRRSTLAQLRKLDFGKGEKIPKLEEVFEQNLKMYDVINVEIKSTGIRTDGIELALADLIRKWKCDDQIVVSSFNPLNLRRFHKAMPGVRLGYLICPEQPIVARNRLAIKSLPIYSLHIDHQMRHHKRFQKLCKFPRIWTWTVNEESEMDYWIDHNADAIITNYPDRLCQKLHA